jgi:hypothetical protein
MGLLFLRFRMAPSIHLLRGYSNIKNPRAGNCLGTFYTVSGKTSEFSENPNAYKLLRLYFHFSAHAPEQALRLIIQLNRNREDNIPADSF